MNWEPCCRPAPLFPKLLVTFLIHVPRCSLPEDISLCLFYWYLWRDAVWLQRRWQLTLQSSTWIVCCSAQSNNVFVTHCQTPYSPPFIFLCSIFCTTKQKYALLSPWQVRECMGIWNLKSLVKLQAIITETTGSAFSFMSVQALPLKWPDRMFQKNTPNKCQFRGKEHIRVSILSKFQYYMSYSENGTVHLSAHK